MKANFVWHTVYAWTFCCFPLPSASRRRRRRHRMLLSTLSRACVLLEAVPGRRLLQERMPLPIIGRRWE